ncbi:MAG TPA: VOC family protein, partial [Acidimicrobiales bacterium]|nr:VOC family protein [Acidimicrobiales bacterium]
MTIRLRQVALVARDLDPTVEELRNLLGVDVCFRDPGVAEFGLVNALFALGDGFLEVVSPKQDGTTAGRLLDKHGGDYGYMVIMQLSDLAEARARLDGLGVRVVWKADLRDAAGTHLHPKDVGGTILSLDWMDQPESWKWAGPEWQKHVATDVVTALSGVAVAVADPEGTAKKWADILGVAATGSRIDLDAGTSISFVKADRPEDEGVCGILVTAADRARVGETATVCGIAVSFV